MANYGSEGAVNREDLMQRVELMEAMIAEGRRSTARYGWIFVLWGLVDLAGIGWQLMQPRFRWVWPITICAGFALMFLGKSMQKQDDCGRTSVKSRTLQGIWSMVGFGLTLYCFAGQFSGTVLTVAYLSAMLTMIGLAHATSAYVLRWRAQGAVAALWWVSAVVMFFAKTNFQVLGVIIVDMLLGMVLFGIYAMVLERRKDESLVQRHA